MTTEIEVSFVGWGRYVVKGLYCKGKVFCKTANKNCRAPMFFVGKTKR